MSNPDIKELLSQLSIFSAEEIGLVVNSFTAKAVKNKTILLRAEDIAEEVYFLTQGCLRLYYEKDGEDISAYFFTENMFAGAYDSFTSRKPSRHFIEAMEDSEVLAISYPQLQQLFQKVPASNEFVRRILEERFQDLHQLFTAQILDNSEERYLNLLQYRPDLIQRIPQHHLATFLGITPVSLSRIRNRISKK